jgi:hypothetical protein
MAEMSAEAAIQNWNFDVSIPELVRADSGRIMGKQKVICDGMPTRLEWIYETSDKA